MNYTNKQEAPVALITGGARRIGASLVKALHKAGYKVVIHCHHSLPQAHELAADLNQQQKESAFVLSRKLTEENSTMELIGSAMDWSGRLDLLVNNASIFIKTDFDSFNSSDWNALFETNVKVPFLLSMAARPFLVKQKGAIINVTDIHAETPLKGYAVYCQTKAALDMQTKALAREFAPDIRVNAVAPGAIAWPENSNALSAEQKEQIINKTPLKQHGHPDYIAQAVLALAQNPFITGQILKVDGGRSLLA